LRNILNTNPDVSRKLRALWALHVTKGLNEKELLTLLDHENEYMRSWAIQLLAEDKNLSDASLKRFAGLAKTDNSALVRLYLASAIQRTSPEKRWETLEALIQRSEDKEDHNLPLMLWYAFEPAVPTDMNKALELALKAQVPNLLPYTVKRVAAINNAESVKTLQSLQQRLEKMEHTPQNHELQTLITKILEPK
jgi:hypothetical protein